MKRYDIAIIGTGPAGVSAAITAKIRSKSTLLLGTAELSRNIRKASLIQNYPGLPSITGVQLQEALKKHLEAMEIEITEDRATLVMPMGDYFMLQTPTEIYEASSVIVATGMAVGKPYPGEEEFLGRGVSCCATCDAPLYRGKTVAVVSFSSDEESEADFMAEYAEKVYYFPMYKGDVHVAKKVEVVREIPTEIVGDIKVSALRTREGEYALDGVFILRGSVAPTQLIPGLEMDGEHVKVNRGMATNVPGCFACGDAAGRPYQYVKAAGEGNVAALSAVAYLDAEKRAKNRV